MPMPQDIMDLLNRYYPNRPGLSQLEILAAGGTQSTPLRQAAAIPNLMSFGSMLGLGDNSSVGRGGPVANPSPGLPPDVSRSPFIDQFPPISAEPSPVGRSPFIN